MSPHYYPYTIRIAQYPVDSTWSKTPVTDAPQQPRKANGGADLYDLIGVHEDWLPARRNRDARPDDPAQWILGEKSDLGRMTVGSIVYQIVQREGIKQDNLTRILYQEAAIDSQILRLQDTWFEGVPPPGDRMTSGLEMELIRLEQQKRAEEVECWRDISRLKEKLMERLGEYRDAARRYQMVGVGLTDNRDLGGM